MLLLRWSHRGIETYESSLLEWVAKADGSQPNLLKHAPIHERLIDLGISIGIECDALVVGGASSTVEHSLLATMQFERGQVTHVDCVSPRRSDLLPDAELIWRDGYFPLEVTPDELPQVEVIICLAASRLFDDPFDTYSELLKCAKPGALVIIDFLDQPIIRSGGLSGLSAWAKREWSSNPETVLTMLRDFARLSMAASSVLGDLKLEVQSDSPELGLRPGSHNCQTVIYETLFPLWYRPGAELEEVMKLIAWQLHYTSVRATIPKIQTFADNNGMHVEALWPLTPDTNVLIARMPHDAKPSVCSRSTTQ